jgi:GNAT superfamily N-acetyltransferase
VSNARAVTAGFTVRPAGPADFADIQAVEDAAGAHFAAIGWASIADDPPPADDELTRAVARASLWVAEDGDGRVVGWAEATVVDGEGHLHQVSVRPENEGAGVGSALVEEVVGWAAARGLPSVTLTTFRDLSWNGPWYSRRGFVALADDDLGPELAAIRESERARGVDVGPRVAMRRSL